MIHEFEFVSMAGCNLAKKICNNMDIQSTFISGYQLRATCGEWLGYKLLDKLEKHFNQNENGIYVKKRTRKG